MFGAKFSKLRKDKNLTQKVMAEILGVTDVTISNFERGARNPDPDMLVKISDKFKVSIDYLLKDTDDGFKPWEVPCFPDINEKVIQAYKSVENWSNEEIESIVNYIEALKALHEKKNAILTANSSDGTKEE